MVRNKKQKNVVLFPGKFEPMHDLLISLAEHDENSTFVFFTMGKDSLPSVSYNLDPAITPNTEVLANYIFEFLSDLRKEQKRLEQADA